MNQTIQVKIRIEHETYYDPNYRGDLDLFTVHFSNLKPTLLSMGDPVTLARSLDLYQGKAYELVSKVRNHNGNWPPANDYIVLVKFRRWLLPSEVK